MENTKGFVYILTNKSFRDDWVKIGKSSRPVDVRSKELDNTAVPLPFDIFATIQTSKYAEVERIVHKQIDRLTDLRIRQKREFFNVQPDQALDILLDQAQVLDDAVVLKYEDGKPYQIYPVIGTPKPMISEKKEQRKPFAFSMVGLKVGDTVTFDPLKIDVKVAGENKIEHENRLWNWLHASSSLHLAVMKNNLMKTCVMRIIKQERHLSQADIFVYKFLKHGGKLSMKE